VVVIGLFYGEGAHLTALVLAGLAFAGLVALGARRVASPLPWAVGGFALWVTMVAARLEPALAGVLIGATFPMRARENSEPSPLLHLERRLQPRVGLGVVLSTYSSMRVSRSTPPRSNSCSHRHRWVWCWG
jgi:NhaA family Na+:H+ antiporter